MTRKIMVLSNSLILRKEAVRYSIELAKRTESSLLFLILPALDSEEFKTFEANFIEGYESTAKNALLEHINDARQDDIHVEVKVNIGDPYSELVKFLAESKSIQTIIWGDKLESNNSKDGLNKSHWLLKLKDKLQYPVVIPSIKE